MTIISKTTVSPICASILSTDFKTSKSIGSSQFGVATGSQGSSGSEPLVCSSKSDKPSPSVSQLPLNRLGIHGLSLAGSCWSFTPSLSASSVFESKASIIPSLSSSNGLAISVPTSSPSSIPSPSVSGLLGSKPKATS